jgi:hypothetical protein
LLGRTGSVSSGAVLDNFPREYIGESNLVCNAHLFFLQFHASSFEASWQGEIGLLFSVLCKIGRLSMGWGYRMSQSLILIDALSSACWGKKTQEKKKKQRERNHQGAFIFQNQTHLSGCAVQDYHGGQVQLKKDLMVSL